MKTMSKINNWVHYQPVPVNRFAGQKSTGKPVAGSTFQELLQQEAVRVDAVKISAHAQKRLQDRNINLGPDDMSKISGAVTKAAAKGARESLLMYGDIALVTSIINRTVVTAMESKDAAEHVFTNIDSAVIIPR